MTMLEIDKAFLLSSIPIGHWSFIIGHFSQKSGAIMPVVRITHE
ncbi:hypothetical protein [Chroococcidiopsis sp.]